MTEPRPSYAPSTPRQAAVPAGAGLICGFVAIVLMPVILGPLGVKLGIVGLVKGDRVLGVVAIVVSVLGVVLSAFMISLTNQM